jgi:predicted nicotinamide N-methyase
MPQRFELQTIERRQLLPTLSVSPEHEEVLGRFLAIQHPPDIPELRLWLVAGHVDLNGRCEELLAGSYAPFWAFCWGGGQALARYVIDHPEMVAGQAVVDFGAGSAVVAIAAARAGAARVIAVDTDPKSRYFAELNAALNGVTIEASASLPERYDVLLASDVFYDLEATRIVREAVDAGRRAYISDAGRPGSYRPPQEPLAWVDARTFPDVDYPIASSAIYKFG